MQRSTGAAPAKCCSYSQSCPYSVAAGSDMCSVHAMMFSSHYAFARTSSEFDSREGEVIGSDRKNYRARDPRVTEKHPPSQRDLDIVAARKSGAKLSTIARQFGICPASVHYALKRVGA